jgi:dTDP-4-dehydrorhamnose reductase
MKILIVGSNGFLGRTFMNQMKHLGHEIHQLNRSSVSSGFFDYANVKTILKENQFDCVISFAWITNLANYRNSAENEKYRDATINLAIESKMNSRDRAIVAINYAKWAAAQKWCKQQGLTFRVITEDAMFRNGRS